MFFSMFLFGLVNTGPGPSATHHGTGPAIRRAYECEALKRQLYRLQSSSSAIRLAKMVTKVAPLKPSGAAMSLDAGSRVVSDGPGHSGWIWRTSDERLLILNRH